MFNRHTVSPEHLSRLSPRGSATPKAPPEAHQLPRWLTGSSLWGLHESQFMGRLTLSWNMSIIEIISSLVTAYFSETKVSFLRETLPCWAEQLPLPCHPAHSEMLSWVAGYSWQQSLWRWWGGKGVNGCSCFISSLDGLVERVKAWEADTPDSESNFHHVFCLCS